MDEFIIRLLFLLVGIVLGYALAMLRNIMLSTRATRANTEACKQCVEELLREYHQDNPHHNHNDGGTT